VRCGAAVWLFCSVLCAQLDGTWLDLQSTRPASASTGDAGNHKLTSGRDGDASASPLVSRFEVTEPHMGTAVRIVVYAADHARASRAVRAAFDRIAALDRALSDYQPTSELMRVSAQAGRGPIAVSADLFRVLEAAQALAHRTRGAFDVTSGASTRLWRRARRLSELPSADRVAEAHALTGYRSFHLDPHARTIALDKPGMSLDVGGLGKGFAGDEAIAVLASHGLTRALVALGGDVVVSDPPPDREGWTIDVSSLDVADAPRPRPLLLRNAAVSTAGDAEQWLSANGSRYSHILDPRTGWPMTLRSSTTVIAPHGLDADRLDTAIAVLGPDEGLPLVEETAGAAAFVVRQESDGRLTIRHSTRWPQS
jgi:FAD:protein FMN transferase